MSDDERMNTAPTGARKAGNLQRAGLIPPEFLLELAKHYGTGSLKYAEHNWRKGMPWHLSYDALCRHLWQFWGGEDYDEETGSKHIVAVAWHAISLAIYMDEHPEFDDRFKTKGNVSE